MNVLAIFAATLLHLGGGYNNAGVAGEVAAINAATSNATATVTVKSVESLTLYTNATAQVVTYEPAWRVTVTNFDAKSGYYLPNDAFPITYAVSGSPITIDSSDQLTFSPQPDWSEPAISMEHGGGWITSFAIESPYVFIGGGEVDVGTLRFNGVAPRETVSPSLEYIEQPATYITNVVGYLNYDDFKWTNGVSTIVGEPVRFDMAITNTVVVQRVPAQTYAKTNTLATVTTSGHFGSVTTNGFLFGGGILVEGAAEGDIIKLIVK